MLYHVPDRPRALSEIRRVLKTSGTFYAATFSEASFSALQKLTDKAGIPIWGDEMGFSLENGAQQLSRWFSHIDVHRLEMPLVVKEAGTLVAMVRSMPTGAAGDKTKLQRLHNLVQQELEQRGEVRFTMEIALFEASGRKEGSYYSAVLPPSTGIVWPVI
jgi:ubiquinone/menaquinone biosynthesis C-methylase UbiE